MLSEPADGALVLPEVRVERCRGLRQLAHQLRVLRGHIRRLAGIGVEVEQRQLEVVVRENLFSLRSLAISRGARIAQWSGTSRSCWSGRCAPPSEAATQLCWRTSR